MTSIVTSGLGSGLDVANIVAQLVAAERAPTQTRLDSREAQALSKLSAFGTVKGALSAFKDAIEPLKDLTAFQGRQATTSNEDLFTATASSTATAGTYSVEITSLALAHKLRSAAFAAPDTVVGTGTLTITSNGQSFQVDIASPTNTVMEIADAINSAEANRDVVATVVNSDEGAHIVLTALQEGTEGAVTIVADGDAGLEALEYDLSGGSTNLVEVVAAQDAILVVDGLTVTSSSNIVADVIDDVTIELLDADPGTTYQLSVAYDQDAAKEKITAFVDAYNNLIQVAANQTGFDAETFVSGPLFGENAVSGLVSGLRSLVGGFVEETSSAFRSLSELGITTSLEGELTVNDSTLSSVLLEQFDDVGAFLSDAGGFAISLGALVDSFLDSSSALETRTSGIEALIDDIGGQREALDRRMALVETRLTSQFAALDGLISQLNNTSTFLGQQLASLPGNSPLTQT